MIVDVSEGNTNNMLVPGVFAVLLSLPFFLLSPVLGIILLSLSISLFTTTNGLQIDPGSFRYRRYIGWFGLKIGRWVKFENILSAKLILSVETAKLVALLGVPQPNKTSKALTYDIVLTDTLDHKLIVYHFLKYKDAVKALNVFAGISDIQIKDKVAEKLHQNRSGRRR